ncbi:MAG TPA: hypothetical protein VLD19_21795, partial [Chitinophagaceae bacterium]|nr:hypothetical protein [Chitinophagaceae bacterium]
GRIRAIPIIDTVPDIWVLTSSGESAYLAAHMGIALSYAQFINPIGGPEAMNIYRQRFKPSAQQAAPKTNVSVFGFCSESEEKAEQVQSVMDYRFLSFEKGRYDDIPSYDIASQYKYGPDEWQRVLHNRQRMIIGTPDIVQEKITKLADDFGVSEVMVATFAESREDRLHSYELLAKLFNLSPAVAAAPATALS